MTDLLLLAGGLVLLAIALGDVVATVLAPEAKGWLSVPIGRGVWAVVRLVGRPPIFRAGGAVAVLATLAVWFLALWLAFAMLIGAAGGAVAASSTGAAADAGPVLRDFYLSGMALTTLGLGDVIASSEAGLIIVVLAAGAGLAVVTAAISYVLSVYPLIARKRGAAAWASDLGADQPEAAAALILQRGDSWLADLHERLNAVDQDLRRFPVLYYFHSSRREEELTSLLRAAFLAVIHLDWTLRNDQGSSAWLYAAPLRAAVGRLTGGLASGFETGDGSVPSTTELTRTLESMAIAARAAGSQTVPPEASEEFRAYVSRSERFLSSFALAHGYEHESLTAPP